jgi:L-cystine uptake protein TcyP (sodium:dicarboxylate symporter family)
MTLLINLAIFGLAIFALMRLESIGLQLSSRVLVGLVTGAALGLVLQNAFDEPVIEQTLNWTNVVGSGYVSLLKMIVMPLILVSMIAAVVKIDHVASLGKIGTTVVSLLVGTTIIAALIGMLVTASLGLTSEGLTEGARELARAETLIASQATVTNLSLPEILLGFIPQNIFSDLTQARPTSIIAVVIFGILTGIAGLKLKLEDPDLGASFQSFMETAQALVIKLVRLVINLTPYGVLALMLKVTASSDGDDILNLIGFIVASYLAIGLMFIVHGLLLAVTANNPISFYRTVWPVLTFAFTSRSSAATIPLNVETQTRDLGVSSPIANLSASFGATIGQNGCAGIYPAMLAVMIAPSMGIDPFDPTFMLTLLGVIAISSFGVAGVGGGATFAALMVLPAMGMPIALVALLISIEPLIDMARTALNVNGAMTTGVITQKILNKV